MICCSKTMSVQDRLRAFLSPPRTPPPPEPPRVSSRKPVAVTPVYSPVLYGPRPGAVSPRQRGTPGSISYQDMEAKQELYNLSQDRHAVLEGDIQKRRARDLLEARRAARALYNDDEPGHQSAIDALSRLLERSGVPDRNAGRTYVLVGNEFTAPRRTGPSRGGRSRRRGRGAPTGYTRAEAARPGAAAP